MAEKDLRKRFPQRLLALLPGPFFYHKISDAAGLGGNKPFDAVLLYEGIMYGIEYKSKSGRVTAYQKHHLSEVVKAGGRSLVVVEGEDLDYIIKDVIIQERSRAEGTD